MIETSNIKVTYQEAKKNIRKYPLLACKSKKVLFCKLSERKLESGWDQTTTRFLSKLHRRKRTEESEKEQRRRGENLLFRRRR